MPFFISVNSIILPKSRPQDLVVTQKVILISLTEKNSLQTKTQHEIRNGNLEMGYGGFPEPLFAANEVSGTHSYILCQTISHLSSLEIDIIKWY